MTTTIIKKTIIKKINKFLINQSEINKALKIDIEKVEAINKREKKQTLELKKSFDICEKIINKLLTNN
jgi:hypothetical protein